MIVAEKLIPNKREVRGIKKKLEKIIDENIEKLWLEKFVLEKSQEIEAL